MVVNIFENDDLRVQLAERMGIPASGFSPLVNPEDDYMVLCWMRNAVKIDNKDTYKTFISYVSGPMYMYEVGDYARGAMCALGVDINVKE